MTLLLLFITLVFAQTFDSHRIRVVPSEDVQSLITAYDAGNHTGQSGGLEIMGEFADKLLTHNYRDESGTTSFTMVDDVGTLNLGAYYAPSKSVSFSGTLPVFTGGQVFTSPTSSESVSGIGDTRLSMQISLLETDTLDVSVIPLADLAIGTEKLLSTQSDRIGAVAAAALDLGDLRLIANLGALTEGVNNLVNLTGGPRALANLGASYRLAEHTAAGIELETTPNLKRNLYPGTDTPGELFMSIRHGENVQITLAGGTNVINGAGAASGRLFLGLTGRLGKRPARTEYVAVLPSPCKPIERPTPIEPGHTFDFGDILFDFDESTIRIPESYDALMRVVTLLEEHTEITNLAVDGHTDARGSDSYNLNLSQHRMNAVVDFLVSKGISRERLVPTGYGESQLLHEHCETEACHQENRRVVFTVIEVENENE